MNKNSTIIKTDEIRNSFKEYCKMEKRKFSEKDFAEFLRFIELDFYDWTRENLRQFFLGKQGSNLNCQE